MQSSFELLAHIVQMLASYAGNLDFITDDEIWEVIRAEVVNLVHSQLIGIGSHFDCLQVYIGIRNEDEALMH
jgi:hypothetical protein